MVWVLVVWSLSWLLWSRSRSRDPNLDYTSGINTSNNECLPHEDPHDDAISNECEEHEDDVEEAEHVIEERVRGVELFPVRVDILHEFGVHVPSQLLVCVEITGSKPGNGRRNVAFCYDVKLSRNYM